MQSRRDQVKAQSALAQRLNRALLLGNPDELESPDRRTGTATVVGVLLGCLIIAGFSVYGLLNPGGATSWQAAGTLVVEKETGSRYLYLGGQLRPVLNYTSARLLLGEALTVKSVSSASLAGVSRGQPIGIAGAPESLPSIPPERQQWTVCSGGDTTTLALSGADEPASEQRPLLVTAAGETFLIWEGRRSRLRAPWLSKVLGYDALAVPVGGAWLDLLPAGPDIDALDVPDRGRPGPILDGRAGMVGQVFAVANTGTQERLYLLLANGLSPLTETGAAIVLGDPATVVAYPGQPPAPLPLSPAAFATATTIAAPAPLADLPASPPRVEPVPAAKLPCARQRLGVDADPVVFVADPPPAAVVRPAPEVTGIRGDVAVAVVAGGGALVTPARAGQAGGGGLHLITDAGVTFAVANQDVAALLGLGDPVAVPSTVLGLLPTGPTLDPSHIRG